MRGFLRWCWFSRRNALSFLGCLYFWRCPMLVAGVLLGLGLGYQSSMVSGLFFLNQSDQFWLCLLVTLIGVQIFVTLRILELHEPERLGFPRPSGKQKLRRFFRRGFAIGIPAGPVILLDYRFYGVAHRIWPVAGCSIAGLTVFAISTALQNLAGAADSDQLIKIQWIARKDVPFYLSLRAG